MGLDPVPQARELAVRRSVVLDFGTTTVQCSGACPRMSALAAHQADPRDDRAREARLTSAGRGSIDLRPRAIEGGGYLQRPLPAAAPDNKRRLLPQDLAGTSSASPISSPRGPRLETASPGDVAHPTEDYATQLQNRWLVYAASMPQIVEDTILMGGVPIYRPQGADKNVGLVLRPNAPVGIGLGVKFH